MNTDEALRRIGQAFDQMVYHAGTPFPYWSVRIIAGPWGTAASFEGTTSLEALTKAADYVMGATHA